LGIGENKRGRPAAFAAFDELAGIKASVFSPIGRRLVFALFAGGSS
jgi:hypothetical protein